MKVKTALETLRNTHPISYADLRTIDNTTRARTDMARLWLLVQIMCEDIRAGFYEMKDE